MKRTLIILLSALLLVFIGITWIKHRPDAATDQATAPGRSAEEKEQIRQFWSVYRQATTDRMAERWSEAAEGYRHALDLNARHEDAWYYLGNMYIELDRDHDAESAFRSLVGVNPGHPRAYMQLASLYLASEDMLDVDQAEAACRRALAINKEETGPVLLLGEVNLIRGRMEEAARQFRDVRSSNFKSTEACFLGGYVAWKQGDRARASDLFDQAVAQARPQDSGQKTGLVEGDTKKGHGFGTITSRSVFRGWMDGLPKADPGDRTLMESLYQGLDTFLDGRRQGLSLKREE